MCRFCKRCFTKVADLTTKKRKKKREILELTCIRKDYNSATNYSRAFSRFETGGKQQNIL